MKLVPELRSMPEGKDVNPEQYLQEAVKFVPWLVLSTGKEVRPVQYLQALSKFVPELTSTLGKEVRPVQLYHA